MKNNASAIRKMQFYISLKLWYNLYCNKRSPCNDLLTAVNLVPVMKYMIGNIVLQTELFLALAALLPGSYHSKMMFTNLLLALHNCCLVAKLLTAFIDCKMYLAGGIRTRYSAPAN